MPHDDQANGAQVELWPTRVFDDKSAGRLQFDYLDSAALVILNSPITDFNYLHRLHRHASYCLCADGGANRLHDLLVNKNPQLGWKDALTQAKPDCIHGDLDSLRDDVRERYEQLEPPVKISKDSDQYSTDFGKAMKKITQQLPDVREILVLGSIGGRVDQGIGLLGELYREQKFRHPHVRLWLFSESSISTILQPGTTVVHTPLSSGVIKRNIGVLPLYGPAIISLKGFEWDVQDWATEMGGQMSTSNHIVADAITVTTDNDVLLTIQRAKSGSNGE